MKSIIQHHFCLLTLVFAFTACLAASDKAEPALAEEFTRAREMMIETQLRARGINDESVLKAFQEVKRHRFMPRETWRQAYGDHPVPIGEGQTISQPYIVAFMTQALRPQPDDKVLEIGTGSGYQAAILARLVKHVYTIEIFESLGNQARSTLKDQGFGNVTVKIGDGFLGWPEHAPFDKIIVTASPKDVPRPLIDQLAVGGRLVIPVGASFNQELRIFAKKDGKLVLENSLPVRFVPMISKDGKRY